MELKDAFDHLTGALKENKGYYYAWQSNIAMLFVDTFAEHHVKKGVHEIANIAAKAFIDRLIEKTEKAEGDR